MRNGLPGLCRCPGPMLNTRIRIPLARSMPPVVVELPPLTRLDVDWTLKNCSRTAHTLLPWLHIFYIKYVYIYIYVCVCVYIYIYFFFYIYICIQNNYVRDLGLTKHQGSRLPCSVRLIAPRAIGKSSTRPYKPERSDNRIYYRGLHN